MSDGDLRINDHLVIPGEELSFTFARSGGPGGQNVNRTATQVELRFDVRHSPSLSETQRELLLLRLRGYIDQSGVLHLFSRATTSQYQNRQEVLERLRSLLARSLHVPRRRIATRPTRASKLTRLERKRRRSVVKHGRSRPHTEDW